MISELIKVTNYILGQDLFVAGTETTSSTVEWAMAEVLRKPETVLAKAKAELNQMIGKGKIVEEADISKLTYLQCIVKESARLHPPVPFLLPRQVTEDIQLSGYIIPSNSQVFQLCLQNTTHRSEQFPPQYSVLPLNPLLVLYF